MSDLMLLGVLRMPPETWDGSGLDVTQRHSRYLQAADRIESDAEEIDKLRELLRDARCPNRYCEGGGVPYYQNGELVAEQCQFCHERTEILKALEGESNARD